MKRNIPLTRFVESVLANHSFWLIGPLLFAGGPKASAMVDAAELSRRVAAVTPRVVEWRRDIHQHPELSNREFRTSALVSTHLRSIGLEVRTNIAHTGVVGLLRGGLPGPVVALRADMDALPVTEMVDLPFKSVVRTQFQGAEVGVMHACGHDHHVAILLGAATVLAGIRSELPGTVLFIFQPAEEGPPPGETGGAKLMISEGALNNPRPDAIFGLHVWPLPAGRIAARSGPVMAGSGDLSIIVRGKQTHGAQPWLGVDPIVVASQIVLGLQTITSRQLDHRNGTAVISIGSIHGGNRHNIIPEDVKMVGTVRSFVPGMEDEILTRIERTVHGIAQSASATAEVTLTDRTLPTVNHPALTARMIPTLQRVARDSFDPAMTAVTASEDFAMLAAQIPGMFFFLGIVPPGEDPAKAPPNHSPYFFADESALPTGVQAMVNLAVDFLKGGGVN